MANKNLKGFLQEVFENIELEDFDYEAIPEMELPENASEEFHKKYLTLTAAKNSPELMGHFKGKYLSSVDLKLKKELGEEKFAELKEQEPDSLKMLDLALNEVKTSASEQTKGTDDKAFANYKKQTIKEIEELNLKLASFENNENKLVSEERNKWLNRLQDAKINEILGGKKFNSSIPTDDVKLLIKNKLNSGPYLIKMDEDLKFKVFDRQNPESEVVKEGKEFTIGQVLDEYSTPYIAVNGNTQTVENNNKPTEKKVVTVQADNPVDGRFIPGHPDYGKKPNV